MNSGSNSNNNEKGVEVRTHDIPIADAMTQFMKEGWAPSPLTGIYSSSINSLHKTTQRQIVETICWQEINFSIRIFKG